MIQLDVIEPIARAAVRALAVGVLESALLALAIFGMTKAWPRSSATTRHVLWWMALAAGVALPLVSFAVSLGHIERHVLDTDIASAARSRVSASIAPNHFREARRMRDVAPAAVAAGEHQRWRAAVEDLERRARSLPPYAGLALFILWLSVAGSGLTILGRSLFVLRRIKANSSALDEAVVRRLRRWRHSARFGREVALAVSNEVDVPVAVGFRTPVILLPSQIVETEAIADIDQIAMHEYAHLERYDDWSNLLQRVLERVFWFNPVVGLIGRRISLEREIACDDWVVAQTGCAHRYATCLWKLVESARLPPKRILAPGALLSPKQITVRIEQLLDARRNALPRLSPFGATAVALACVALIVLQAQSAPGIALTEVAPAPPAAQILPALVSAPRVAPRAPSPVTASLAIRLAERSSVHRRKALAAAAIDSSAHTKAAASQGRAARRPAAVLLTPPRGSAPLKAAPAASTAPQIPRVIPPDVALAPLTDQRADLHIARSELEETMRVTSRVVALAAPAMPPKVAANATTSARAVLERCAGCDLAGLNLRGADLHGINLNGADLHGADLRDANLSGARLTGVDLHGARLDGVDLRNAVLNGSELQGMSLRNAQLEGVRLIGASLHDVDLTGTRARSLIDGCQACDLSRIDLHGQDLHGIMLSGASLDGANLRNVNLSGAHLEAVSLERADLTGADLHGALLRDCNLHGADLSAANLSGTNLDGSNAHGAPPMARDGAPIATADDEGDQLVADSSSVVHQGHLPRPSNNAPPRCPDSGG